MSVQRILRGQAATLVTYPAVDGGAGPVYAQASTAIARTRTPATTMPDEGSESTATRDTISGTTSADAVKGATAIVLTATKAVVRGRRYLIAVLNGGTFPVICDKTGTLSTIPLAEPLPQAVVAGSTFLGWSISISLSTVNTDVEGYGVSIVTATVDGVLYTWPAPFQIVRRIVSWGLTPNELTRRLPEIRARQNQNDRDFEELIVTSREDELIPRLQNRGFDPDSIINSDVLLPAQVAACWWRSVKYDAKKSEADKKIAESELDRQIDRALGSPGWWDAPQVEQPPGPDPDAAVQRRTVRLSR